MFSIFLQEPFFVMMESWCETTSVMVSDFLLIILSCNYSLSTSEFPGGHCIFSNLRVSY